MENNIHVNSFSLGDFIHYLGNDLKAAAKLSLQINRERLGSLFIIFGDVIRSMHHPGDGRYLEIAKGYRNPNSYEEINEIEALYGTEVKDFLIEAIKGNVTVNQVLEFLGTIDSTANSSNINRPLHFGNRV